MLIVSSIVFKRKDFHSKLFSLGAKPKVNDIWIRLCILWNSTKGERLWQCSLLVFLYHTKLLYMYTGNEV